jgi:aspartyl-tRNA synthetase
MSSSSEIPKPTAALPAPPSPYRTHRAHELGAEHAGQVLTLAGWIERKRELGSVVFVELRDSGALVQCVVEAGTPAFEVLSGARIESVVRVTGVLELRPTTTRNPRQARGDVELRVSSLEVLSSAEVLPFAISGAAEPPEELRLRYRYLDLRRARLRKNLLLRAKLLARLRELLTARDFVEVTTPILTSSSPEGARDFLVPSRLHPGKFYALPQAPQLFKQLLMVAGIDRYFQIAPCFRDEDARRDRSPGEFYQLDLELAFADQDQIFSTIEPVLFQVFAELGAFPAGPPPFPRIAYRDALLRFGSDKPDLRNELELRDATPWFREKPFGAVVADASAVQARALLAPGAAARSRRFFDDLAAVVERSGVSTFSYVALKENPQGPLARVRERDLSALCELVSAKPGDAVLLLAGSGKSLDTAASALRTATAQALGLIGQDCYRFCWVVDFPMYERNPDTGKIEFLHNPFSMPQGGLAALAGDPEAVLAHQYDIVCNGIELSSGAIRNHRPEIMLRAFELAGYGADEVERRFGAMLSAFRFGAPPHGGLAPGIDRMLMLLADEPNLREVVVFPLTQNAEDLLMQAPSEVTERQLDELGITIRSRFPPA